MISGIVVQMPSGLHPRIVISLWGSDGRLYSCQATVDTGFTGTLTLPFQFIERLGLVPGGLSVVTLANGRSEEVNHYHAEVLWHSRAERVVVYQSEGDPLVGMDLLRNSRLTVDAWDGGIVAIEEAEWQDGQARPY